MINREQTLRSLPDNVGSFFQLQEAGIAFVDPLYGERLGAWPKVLSHDAISSGGREYLQAAGHHLDVIYSAHRRAGDFSDVLREHGDVLEAAAVLAIEADWKPEHIDDFANPDIVQLPGGRHEEFLRAEIEWARSRGKIILPYDIDGPDDPLRQSLLKLFGGSDPSSVPFPADIPKDMRPELAEELCSGAYACMRHPMLLGQLGFGLGSLAGRGYIDQNVRVVATLGVGNYPNFVSKARTAGIMPAADISSFIVEQPTDDWRLYVDMRKSASFVSMATKAGMTTAEMLDRIRA